MLFNLRSLFAAILACSCLAPCAAQLPVIELMAISKLGGKVGSELELRCSAGSRLDEVVQLRFSHPGITSELMTDDPLPFSQQRQPRYGSFRVKIAASVPPGRYECRAVGRHGVSNPRAFLVHTLGDVAAAPSNTKDQPAPLPRGTVHHGKAANAQVHYFSLHVDQGQTLRIDCLAVQVDSRMIPTLTLFDSSGQTLQTRNGSDSVDPYLIVEAYQAGDYLLAVHDAIYRGGEEFGYLLVAQLNDSAVNLIPPIGQTSEGQIPVAWLPSASSGFTGLADNAIEMEETSDAQPITPPCTIRASFDSRDDEDAYEFTAKQDEQLAIDLISQRIGQPTDCRMILQRKEPQQAGDPKWHAVFNEDDSQNIGDAALKLRTTDPFAMFKAPAAATYRLTIRDLDSGTSLRGQQDYFVNLRRPSPGFDLVAYRPFPTNDQNASRQHGSHLLRGGTEAIRVYCVRRDGWSGPIELTVEGLPEGVSCAPATIGANQNQTQLTLVAGENASAAVANLRVVGRSTVGGQERSVPATPAAIQFGRGHLREYIRSRLTADLAMGVSDKDLCPISITVGDGKVAEVKKGDSLTLPVKLTRREGGKTNCVVRPRDLPPTVTSGDVTINADKNEGNVVLKVPGNATPGTYSLWLQVETKIKFKPNPQALQRANAYRAQLQKLSEDPASADQRETINEAIKAADGRIEEAKGSAKEQELTIYLPSPHVTIRIVEAI